MPRQTLRLAPADVLLGFEKVIEVTWFFRSSIEPGSLQASFQALVKKYPPLSGVVTRMPGHHRSPLHGWHVTSPKFVGRGATIALHAQHERGTSWQAAALPDPASGSRTLMRGAQSASKIMSGSAPVVAATLTNFTDGGSAIGLAVSHALMDASGVYRLAREWSQLHEQGGSCEQELVFSRDCVQERMVQHGAAFRRASSALDLTSWRGSGVFWMVRALSQQQLGCEPPRMHVSLSKAEVDTFRVWSRPSRASWRPSAYEALSAVLLKAVSRLLTLPSGRRFHVQGVFDARRAARLPQAFTGNAFYLLGSPCMDAPPHTLPLADVCETMHEMVLRAYLGNSFAEPSTLAGGWLQHQLMLEHGLLPSHPIGQEASASGSPQEGDGRLPLYQIITNFQGARAGLK
jgi:hypothetical protein